MTLSSYGFTVDHRGLSNEQSAKVQAFKRILQQSGTWDERSFDEHDCARFLKARNYDLQAAKQMWDSMLQWRRENRVDTIRDWFVFHERREYDAVFPTGLHKTDREGHPVLIQQLGRVNIGALYKVTTDERIRLAHIAENEHLQRVVFPACSRSAGRPIDQLFTIIDLEGVAFTSMMRTTSLLKMFMTMDSNNYPETLARMAIINAPGWFSTSWSAVKSVLSGDTVRKIQIFGKDYHTALLQHIPRENLLVEYGGLSRGCITNNEGPWQEPIPEPPAPTMSMVPGAQMPTGKQTPATDAGAGDSESLQLANGGDQRTPRDVSLVRRSQSPVRPGAKASAAGGPSPAALAAAGGPAVHPAPAVSPPLAKRPHYDEQQKLPQQAPAPASGSSPAPSVSDTSSNVGLSMAAPLLSNFLPASAEGKSAQYNAPASHAALPGSPSLGHSGGPESSQPPLRRGSSAGFSGALVSSLVSGFQTMASHVGSHPHHPNSRTSTPAASSNPGPMHPLATSSMSLTSPSGAAAQRSPLPGSRGPGRGSRAEPLQLASPRDDVTGPGTVFSAVSSVYSLASVLSPTSPQDVGADTATSRILDSATSIKSGPTHQLGVVAESGRAANAYSRQISAGGSSTGLGGSTYLAGMAAATGNPSSAFCSGVLATSDMFPQQADTDDAESIRFSVMSQRSFYSALSHLDPSTSSGLTSPNEASENARRYSLQRELHAAAIASALAATAEQRRAATAAATTPLPPAATGRAAAGPNATTSPMPQALALATVRFAVPPAAQQAFGSYLDQPPPYGSMRTGDSSFTGTAGSPAPAQAGGTSLPHQAGSANMTGGPGHGQPESTCRTQPPQDDAVVVQIGASNASVGGLSRSPSLATVDDCSLGAGAVRWAKGWFFRRRNYGRLVENDAAADASGIAGGSRNSGGGGSLEGGRQAATTMTRKGSSGAIYASMQDGPSTTSPSKVMPKGSGGPHHSRGDSWEWDQPSPYDIDQTYSRGGGMMQRDMSFGRGGERRRLLRTDSPGKRRSLEDMFSCLPCCTVM